MITTKDCFAKYGDPSLHNGMAIWDVPTELEIGVIPKRIYCNKDLIVPLTNAFKSLISTGKVTELKTWDGCFNIRVVRGYEKKYERYKLEHRYLEANELLSMHAWGVAIDINAFENGIGMHPKLSDGLIKCFEDAGFDWGGRWKRIDGMHFQLKKI